jgi:hypothetical protein
MVLLRLHACDDRWPPQRRPTRRPPESDAMPCRSPPQRSYTASALRGLYLDWIRFPSSTEMRNAADAQILRYDRRRRPVAGSRRSFLDTRRLSRLVQRHPAAQRARTSSVRTRAGGLTTMVEEATVRLSHCSLCTWRALHFRRHSPDTLHSVGVFDTGLEVIVSFLRRLAATSGTPATGS